MAPTPLPLVVQSKMLSTVNNNNRDAFVLRYYRWTCDNNKECLRCMDKCTKQVKSKGIVIQRGPMQACHMDCTRRYQNRPPRGAKQKVNAKPLKGCGSGKVLNKRTGRCIKNNGATAKALNNKTCNSNKVYNKRTGRCVLKSDGNKPEMAKANANLTKANANLVNTNAKERVKTPKKKLVKTIPTRTLEQIREQCFVARDAQGNWHKVRTPKGFFFRRDPDDYFLSGINKHGTRIVYQPIQYGFKSGPNKGGCEESYIENPTARMGFLYGRTYHDYESYKLYTPKHRSMLQHENEGHKLYRGRPRKIPKCSITIYGDGSKSKPFKLKVNATDPKLSFWGV